MYSRLASISMSDNIEDCDIFCDIGIESMKLAVLADGSSDGACEKADSCIGSSAMPSRYGTTDF